MRQGQRRPTIWRRKPEPAKRQAIRPDRTAPDVFEDRANGRPDGLPTLVERMAIPAVPRLP